MDPEDLHLDGNAAAGVLAAVFGDEMTVNVTVCGTCGTDNPVGRLVAYIHGMGAILRCPRCGNALIRVAYRPGRYVLDLGGSRTLELKEPANARPRP